MEEEETTDTASAAANGFDETRGGIQWGGGINRLVACRCS